MIHFSHVYKTYPGPCHALKNVNIVVGKGEFVFLTGPSGAGKTTLFRMISAFDRVTSGSIRIANFDLTKMNEQILPMFRRKIGVVFQDFRLLKDRTVFENVALPLQVIGESKLIIKRKVEDIIDRVGLSHKKNDFPLQMSGGEQQRVAIARGLIHQPGILIADEPTGNLDHDLSRDIMDLLEKVNAQGTTVFVATHDLSLVQKKNNRVFRIQNGEIMELNKDQKGMV